jgi:hypothetical protein
MRPLSTFLRLFHEHVGSSHLPIGHGNVFGFYNAGCIGPMATLTY